MAPRNRHRKTTRNRAVKVVVIFKLPAASGATFLYRPAPVWCSGGSKNAETQNFPRNTWFDKGSAYVVNWVSRSWLPGLCTGRFNPRSVYRSVCFLCWSNTRAQRISGWIHLRTTIQMLPWASTKTTGSLPYPRTWPQLQIIIKTRIEQRISLKSSFRIFVAIYCSFSRHSPSNSFKSLFVAFLLDSRALRSLLRSGP